MARLLTEAWRRSLKEIHSGRCNVTTSSSPACGNVLQFLQFDHVPSTALFAPFGIQAKRQDTFTDFGHQRTDLTVCQRAAVIAGSAIGALVDPARDDLVAALGETTGEASYRRVLNRMRCSHEGRMILEDKPILRESTLAQVWNMPLHTFGGKYAAFMKKRGFSPDERMPVRFIADEDLAYVAQRSREVHDFWHVLFDVNTDVSGELTLKMIELVQTGLPMCYLAVTAGPLRLPAHKRRDLLVNNFPWARTAAHRAVDLMCVYYERHFEEDIECLRQKLHIHPFVKV